MSKPDENLSPSKKGESKKKKLAENKQDQGKDVEQQQLIIAVDPETKEQLTIKQIQELLFSSTGKKYDFIPTEKRVGVFVDFNLLKYPSKAHPMRYTPLTYELANDQDFMIIKLIVPTPIFDLYNAEMKLFELDFDSAIDCFQHRLLEYIASDLKSTSEAYIDSARKRFMKNALEQLDSVNEKFLYDYPDED